MGCTAWDPHGRVLDWGLRQHLSVGGVGPGVGVCGPAGAGGGGGSLGPSGPGCAGRRAQHTLRVPRLVRRVPGAACVHAGIATWRAVLGMEPRLWLPPRGLLALTEKDLQRAVQKPFLLAVSPGGSSGVPCSGNVEGEAGSALGRLTALPRPLPIDFAVNLEQQRVMVEAFKEFALGWSRSAPEQTPRIRAQGRACACPWQRRGRAVSADPAGWAGGKTTSWHKRLRVVFGAKI